MELALEVGDLGLLLLGQVMLVIKILDQQHVNVDHTLEVGLGGVDIGLSIIQTEAMFLYERADVTMVGFLDSVELLLLDLGLVALETLEKRLLVGLRPGNRHKGSDGKRKHKCHLVVCDVVGLTIECE